MDKQVKDCPFCGHHASLLTFDKIDRPGMFANRTWIHKVRCNKCSMQTKECKTEKQALEIWNRRVEDGKKEDSIN